MGIKVSGHRKGRKKVPPLPKSKIAEYRKKLKDPEYMKNAIEVAAKKITNEILKGRD